MLYLFMSFDTARAHADVAQFSLSRINRKNERERRQHILCLCIKNQAQHCNANAYASAFYANLYLLYRSTQNGAKKVYRGEKKFLFALNICIRLCWCNAHASAHTKVKCN